MAESAGNPVVLVIGAAVMDGIGHACAVEAARAGNNVVLLDIERPSDMVPPIEAETGWRSAWPLLGAQLSAVGAGISGRVAGAVALYRNRGRTEQDLRLAVGELFDVLEKIRPAVKAEMLRGDEADLFNISNSFTSRHLNEKQKGNYDSTPWHSWMYYVNLSTIHLITRLMNRNTRQAASAALDPAHG